MPPPLMYAYGCHSPGVADWPQPSVPCSTSALNWRVVAANTDAVPATSTHTPARVAPHARNEAAVSPHPAITGVPAFSPQRRRHAGRHVADHRVRVDDARQLAHRHVEHPAELRVPLSAQRCPQNR